MLSLERLLLYAGFGSWAVEFSVARLPAVEAEVILKPVCPLGGR
jgi:hypothetical protein